MLKYWFKSIIPFRRTPVLVYHKVDNIPKGHDRFRLSTKSFEKQMSHISGKKKCLTLEEYVTRLTNGEEISNNSVMITFDDGYEDNFLHAFPILREYGLKATFFIPTSYVGATNKWDEGLGEIPSKLLSWHQIRTMTRAGMAFGSHSCTHSKLTNCTAQRLRHELSYSKKVLERQLGKPVKLFSFPYGASNAKTTQFVKASGYVAACSDTINTEKPCLYNLNRIPVYSHDGLVLFKIKVSGCYTWLERLLTQVKVLGAIRMGRTIMKIRQ